MKKGQSFVELAIGSVVFLFIISGLVDFGRIYFTHIALEDAAANSALYYGLHSECPYDGIRDYGLPDAKQVSDDGVTGVVDLFPFYTVNAQTYYDNGKCDSPNNAVYRAEEAGGEMINWPKTSVNTYITYDELTETYHAHTDISYNFRMVSPIFMPMFPNGLTLSSSASVPVMHYEKILSEYRNH